MAHVSGTQLINEHHSTCHKLIRLQGRKFQLLWEPAWKI